MRPRSSRFSPLSPLSLVKPALRAAAFLAGATLAADARAGEPYSCCDLAVSGGACIAQAAPCATPPKFGVALADLSASTAQNWPLPPGASNATFPEGTDGYLLQSSAPPWVGICLDAPSAQDPNHQGPTEPAACLTISLAPGVSAESAVATIANDPRWDAYQLCYGAPTGDAELGCRDVGDNFDPTVSPTPASGSCCGPARPLGNGSIVINQLIPGVPPPVLAYNDGGALIPLSQYNGAAGDTLQTVPNMCLSAFEEPAACGTGPSDAGPWPILAPCVPTTCAAQCQICGSVPDGCGGTLDCSSNCAALAKGTCSAAPGSHEFEAGGAAIVAMLGLSFLRSRHRRAR